MSMKDNIDVLIEDIFGSIARFENLTGILIKEIEQKYENICGTPILVDRKITFCQGNGSIKEQHPKPYKNE